MADIGSDVNFFLKALYYRMQLVNALFISTN